MDKFYTPLPSRFLRPFTGFMLLFLLGVTFDLGAQCNNINQVSFTPADTTHCGYPLTLDFQSTSSVDSTPVFLIAKTSPPNFKSNFSFSFPTTNTGCYYYLEIEGIFTLWSNTDDYYDAFGKFDITTNQLISAGLPNALAITPPLFKLPSTFSTGHVYRYYYQGNGSNITVNFNDNLLNDNSGSMTFSWYVVPCFSTSWEFGDGGTSTETNVSHTYTSPGTYPVTLTVTNELDGCSEAFTGWSMSFPWRQPTWRPPYVQVRAIRWGSNIYTESGIYSEVFTTYLGCDSTVTLDLLVLDPAASILPPSTIDCNNSTITLDGSNSSGGPGVTYQWTGPAPGCILGNSTQPTITVGCAGTYSLQVTKTAADGTQCSATAQVSVLENLETPLIELDETVDFPCDASEIELTAIVTSSSPNLTYNWQSSTGMILSGTNTPTVTIGSAGVYQLEVFNIDNGCSATGEVTVTGAPAMHLSWEAIAPDCLNPTGTITISVASGGEPPFLYSIDGGNQFQQESTFHELDAGAYAIVAQDATGCETEPELVLLEAVIPIMVEIDAEASIYPGESYQLEAWVNLPTDQLDSIQWTPSESLSCSDCLTPIASPVSTTEYLVEVWDVHGCYASATVLVVVEISSVYAPNTFTPDGDGINDHFMLLSRPGSVANVRSFRIFNRWGQEVFYHSNFLPNDPVYAWNGIFKGEKMASDVYAWFAEVEFADGSLEVLKGGVELLR
ncbi:MAG: PKD domain-containing protein [Saprospirales bacterium]|nr:PKD domain-containing protein [Saprospirales bacterium]